MKKSKMKKIKLNKSILIILSVIILLIIGFFVFLSPKELETTVNTPQATGNAGGSTVTPTPVKKYYLDEEQKNILGQTLLSSEFVKDIPKEGIIALKFYDFVNGERIWLERVLIGSEGFLNSGEPDMTLMMHGRYISQLNGANLCDIINNAKTNGEMWVESEQSNTKLFFKYAGMMKYRDCLGL
jgi:competence protein ComGC